MSVKIRLRRMGKKKQPHYRIVVADSRSPRDGRFVEILGYYSPITQPARLRVDLERVDYWLGEGAIASRTVGNLVAKARVGGDDKVALEGDRSEAEAEAAGESVAEGAEAVADADAAAEPEAAVEPEAAASAEAPADAPEAEAPEPEAEEAQTTDEDAAE
ncbi:MAG: 30S ribosomal protein S16 [Gemmatimonadetes bacterium]|nr:30S ribosomal protein S16 [Gemmatimonadota bacterium]MYI06825.1 30S ribosomal protein S16 [Gemmatimonadota bacterium]